MVDAWETHRQQWHWDVPERFNLAHACAVRWSNDATASKRTALLTRAASGNYETTDYHNLSSLALTFAAFLHESQIRIGERVAVVLPQRTETAVALLGIVALGAVAVPLTVLFGVDALTYRLRDAQCKAVVCDALTLKNILAIRGELPALRHVIVCDAEADSALPHDVVSFAEAIASSSPIPLVADTLANDPAFIIYTSGTTGPPKGAAIPHRAMYGNLPGFLYSHNLRPDPRKALEDVVPFVFWSPADWAWTGGLWDALLPTLFLGQTVVGQAGRFDPTAAFDLMERCKVTATFLFPTALKMMMKAVPNPREKYSLHLRSIMSAGEAVGDTVFSWTQSALGITTNEMFGQTELNYIVGNSHSIWPAKPGSMGRGYPGHRVAVVNDECKPVLAGETGEIAVNRFDVHGNLDPVFFLGYLNNDAATDAKYTGDWCRTGDVARVDADGYFWYEGRSDDVIKSAGYRIGPAEVESCLIQHPAVAMAAVIGKPDTERGAIVKAFIVLSTAYAHIAQSIAQRTALEAELAQHVRGKLAPYEYPKEFEFVSELPMTTTGKIQRKVLRERENMLCTHGGTPRVK